MHGEKCRRRMHGGRNDQTGEKMIANTAVHTVKTSLSGKLVGRKVGRLVGR